MKTKFKLIFKQFLFLFSVYFGLRLLFLIYNWSRFRKLAGAEIFDAFALGARIDISTLLWMQTFFIFYELLRPVKTWKWPQWLWVDRALYFIFYMVHSFFLFANLVDTELTNFMGQRMSLNIFNLQGDIERQAGQIIFHYWYMFALFLAVVLLLISFYPRLNTSKEPEVFSSKFHQVFAAVLLLLFLPLGVRGGLQRKPLKPTHALSFSSVDLSQLALNTTFTMIHSSQNHKESRLKWDPHPQLKSERLSTSNYYMGTKPKNVVLFIMESFALEYCGFANQGMGYTPFLDELAQQAIVFKNAFANGRRSIEAVPSLLAGIPSWTQDPFLMSNYQGIQIQGVANLLAKQGFHTAFFHGAENGSMYFDAFASRTGFQNYFGRNEYPHPERDFDGYWGILDEPFFQYVLESANVEKSSFFYTVFSLSSHQPYPVPSHLKAKFPKGTLEIHESIGYADYALRQFFLRAKDQPWFKDTLFIITADHTSKSDQPSYQNTPGAYRVPLLLYFPGVNLKVDADRIVQHADIAHTILDMTGAPSSQLGAFGRSVFSKDEGFVINGNQSHGFWYKDSSTSFRLNAAGEISKLVDDANANAIDRDQTVQVQKAKHILQKFINGMIDNKLYEER